MNSGNCTICGGHMDERQMFANGTPGDDGCHPHWECLDCTANEDNRSGWLGWCFNCNAVAGLGSWRCMVCNKDIVPWHEVDLQKLKGEVIEV